MHSCTKQLTELGACQPNVVQTHGRAGSVFDLGLRERFLPLLDELHQRRAAATIVHHCSHHQHLIVKHESEQGVWAQVGRARSRLALLGMSSAHVGPRLGTLQRAAVAIAADACWRATAWTGDVAISKDLT